jgi:hypothetical protein
MLPKNDFLKTLSHVCLLCSALTGYVYGSTFNNAPLVPVGVFPSAIAVGDLNRDGKLDMVVANVNDSSLSILIGNGNGTFKPQTGVALDGRPVAVAVGDFNNDGIPDVVALTTDVFILLGNGDGTFRIGRMFALAEAPIAITLSDFNGDGNLDLAVTHLSGVDIALGNGDGTFKAPVTYKCGAGPNGVRTGDFNGDGKIDLVVSDQNPNTGAIAVNVLLGKGDGTFGSPIETSGLNSGGGNLVVGDFNKDGKLDVAVGSNIFETNQTSPFAVLFGDGTGKFMNPEYITTGLGSAFLVKGDFNSDGKLDLAVANGSNGDVTVVTGNGKGQFKIGANYAAGFTLPGVSAVVGDFNGDGKPDIAVANNGGSNVSVLLNLGGGRFAGAQDFRTTSFGQFVAEGDFNRDGKEDLVIGGEFSVGVLLGKGNGTFGAFKSVNIGKDGAGFVVTGDFNGDGISDVATFLGGGSSVTVLLGKGDGSFKVPRTFFAGANLVWMAVGDFNNDGKLDLVMCAGKFVIVLLGNGNGTFQSPKYTLLANPPMSVAAADFDGDGRLDVAVTNQVNGNVGILLGKGDGTFGNPRNFPAGGVFALSVTVGDFNGDGKLDLATNAVSVLLGNGDGTFGKPLNRKVNAPLTGSIVTGDFNLDGKLDLAVGSSGAGAFVLYGNGDGTLKPAAPIGSTQGWITKGDFNGDGKPDLVSISNGGVTILLNTSK